MSDGVLPSITWDRPLCLLLLLLLPWARPPRPPALALGTLGLLKSLPHPPTWRRRLHALPVWLRRVWLLLLVVALAGPRTAAASVARVSPGRSLAFVVDTSGSMGVTETLADGATRTRLDHAKRLVHAIVAARGREPHAGADRYSLVELSGAPRIVTPPTGHLPALRHLVDALEVDPLQDRTNLGDALALALAELAEGPAGSRAVVLVTDGAHNRPGDVGPMEAGRIAEALSIPVYVVVLGDPALSLDPAGTERDAAKLETLARRSGGLAFRATNAALVGTIAGRIEALVVPPATATPQPDVRGWQRKLILGAVGLAVVELLLTGLVLRVRPGGV